MPLVRQAPQVSQAVEVKAEPIADNYAFMGVPVDVYRHFSVELGKVEEKDVGKLKDVYDWAKSKCEEPTIGNILQRIASLENQLGVPDIGHRRYDKMWNWIRLSRNIDDLDKRREALRKRWL